MKSKTNGLLSVLFCGLVLNLHGCAGPVAPQQQQRSSLQVQAYQTQSFETQKRIAFASVMSVLQDLGYIIGSADLETGFITANSPTVTDKSEAAESYRVLFGISSELSTSVTAFIEELQPNNTRVRLNFVEKSRASGPYGRNFAVDVPLHDEKIYANAFNLVGDAIFIRSKTK